MQSVKRGVQRAECKVYIVVECQLCSVKCGVWSVVECGVECETFIVIVESGKVE